jgi:hypothetical protein
VFHRFISGHRRSTLRGHHQRVTVSISMRKLCLARLSSHTCVVSAATGDSRNLLVHALGSSSLIFSDYLPKDWQGAFNVLKQKISRQLIVQDDLLLTVLRRVVQSRCVFSTMIGHQPSSHPPDTRNSPIPLVCIPLYASPLVQRPSA